MNENDMIENLGISKQRFNQLSNACFQVLCKTPVAAYTPGEILQNTFEIVPDLTPKEAFWLGLKLGALKTPSAEQLKNYLSLSRK